MTRRWRRTPTGLTLLASAVVAVGVGAAGCDSGADPAPSPSASTSASTSSSGSPTPSATPSPSDTPTIPAAARKQTPEGAEAFVRYFMDRVNTAWMTPATGVIAADSTADCKFCKTTEETAAWLVEHDQRYARPPVSLETVAPLSGAPAGQIYLSVVMVQNASDIVDGSGAVRSTEERKRLDRNIAVKWVSGRWLMFAVEKAS